MLKSKPAFVLSSWIGTCNLLGLPSFQTEIPSVQGLLTRARQILAKPGFIIGADVTELQKFLDAVVVSSLLRRSGNSPSPQVNRVCFCYSPSTSLEGGISLGPLGRFKGNSGTISLGICTYHPPSCSEISLDRWSHTGFFKVRGK